MTFEIGEACLRSDRERSAELAALWLSIVFAVYLFADLVLGSCVVYRKLRDSRVKKT